MALPLILRESRLISGKGVLKVPASLPPVRYRILYLDVVRRPRQEYLNFAWNPPRSRYANITFLQNGYVIGSAPMEFPRSSHAEASDIAGQTLIALKCAYSGILQTFVNLGIALNIPPISVTNAIVDYENLNLSWDEVRIACYADTAISARLFTKGYDVCNPDFDDEDKPPPPPPPPPPVPPGQPIDDISPPYEGSDDGGNTEPFPGDNNEPGQEPCARYLVRIRIFGAFAGGFADFDLILYGRLGDVITNRIGTPYVDVECQGIDGDPCQDFPQRIRVFTGQPENPSSPDAIYLSVEAL